MERLNVSIVKREYCYRTTDDKLHSGPKAKERAEKWQKSINIRNSVETELTPKFIKSCGIDNKKKAFDFFKKIEHFISFFEEEYRLQKNCDRKDILNCVDYFLTDAVRAVTNEPEGTKMFIETLKWIEDITQKG